MSSKWKVEKMMEEEKIYVSNNTNEAEECLTDGDCTKLGQMLSNQGFYYQSSFLFLQHHNQGQLSRFPIQSI